MKDSLPTSPAAARDADPGVGEWYDRVRKLLDSGSTVEFSPKGYSMWPTLVPGRDVVRMAHCPSPRAGDIVLARWDGKVVLHRVIGICGGGYILRGDSNLYQTETCPATDIAGRVECIMRGGRDISGSLRVRILAAIQRMPVPVRRLAVRIINLRKNGK